MTGEQSRRLTLDLQPGSEPIEGRISEEGAESRPFVGWLALATALQQAMRLDPRTASDDRPGGSGR